LGIDRGLGTDLHGWEPSPWPYPFEGEGDHRFVVTMRTKKIGGYKQVAPNGAWRSEAKFARLRVSGLRVEGPGGGEGGKKPKRRNRRQVDFKG
jgi:hypothetical protein